MSKRTAQVAKLLQQEINNIFIRDFESPMGTLVSISEVSVSSDLKNATAYISIIPHDKIGSTLEKVKKFGNHVQKEIGRRIAIKTTPRIKWELDERDLKYEALEEADK